MGEISTAVEQDAIADSILSDDNIVGSHVAETLADSPAEFQEAKQIAEQGEDQASQQGEQQQVDDPPLTAEELEAMSLAEQGQPEQVQEIPAGQQQQVEQPQQQVPDFQSWRQNAYQYAQQLSTPETAAHFAFDFLSAFGVDQNTAAQFAQSGQGRMLADVMMAYAMSAINTLLPHYFQAPSGQEGRNVLQALVENQYEGLGDSHAAAMEAKAWDQARAGTNLPAYGTPEFEAMMAKVNESYPNLAKVKFDGATTKAERLLARAQLAKQIALGQRLSPEMARQAFRNGQLAARQSAARRSAGNLGQGMSAQNFGGRVSEDEAFWSNPQAWNQYVEKKL